MQSNGTPSGACPQHRHTCDMRQARGADPHTSGLPHVRGTLDTILFLSNVRAASPHTFDFCSTLEACLVRPWAALLALLRSLCAAFFTPGGRQHMLLSAGSDRNQDRMSLLQGIQIPPTTPSGVASTS